MSAERTTVPPWALRPVEGAKEVPRWTEEAENFEPDTKMRGSKQARSDDPRPNAGYTCGGDYYPHEIGDGTTTAAQRFECAACGLGKVLGVEHDVRNHQIKFACKACRSQTYHNPAGFNPLVIVPFDCETYPTGRVPADDGDS